MSDSNKPEALLGRLVAGRYRVLKPLGEGGMGQVFLAEHEAIEKKVALKVLRPEFSRKDDIVTRFQQEAISASRIKHPNVLDVFDFGRLETGEAFLAMEFLEGHDLSDELAKRNVLDPARAIPIALQICRALGAAHSRGVVHRDMKPDNVFLQRTADGEEIVKIVDFGIAQLRSTEEAAKAQPTRRRLTKTGMIFGTPEYMAPEQAAGRPADLRVDVYAVGVILYEMFTGAVPFTGDSFMAVLAATLNEPPPPMRQMNPDLRIGPELEAVISKALAKAPVDRFASMAALGAALVATPEGGPFHYAVPGAATEARASAYPAAMAQATAAQFGAPVGSLPPPPPLASPGLATAQIGTPAVASVKKTTPVDGQASTVAPVTKPNQAVIFASIAGAIAFAGVIGFVAMNRSARGPSTQQDTSTPKLAAEPTKTEPAEPAPQVAPAASENTTVTPAVPTNELTLHVATDPAGAVVLKSGFQVCDATPCDIVVGRNEAVELEARKGALRAQSKILAQREQTVQMTLVPPAPKQKPPGERLCEVSVGELKVLRPCPK